MKYQNKRNGKVTANVTFDEKFKTYAIEFEDGTNTVITSATLKRWYVPMEEESESKTTADFAKELAESITSHIEENKVPSLSEMVAPAVESLNDSEKELTDEQYAEIGKEIAEQAKEKAARAKKNKKVKDPKRDTQESIKVIIGIIEKVGMTVRTYPSDPRTITVKNIDGKSLGDIHVGDKKFVLAIHENVVPQGWQADRVRNCLNSHAFDIVYDELNKLENLLNAIKEEN